MDSKRCIKQYQHLYSNDNFNRRHFCNSYFYSNKQYLYRWGFNQSVFRVWCTKHSLTKVWSEAAGRWLVK